MSWGVLEGGLLERLGVVEGVVLEGVVLEGGCIEGGLCKSEGGVDTLTRW